MQLDEIVVIVIGVKYEGTNVKGSYVDEDVLFEKSSEAQSGGDTHGSGVSFNKSRRRPER